jgi:uncharacterized membrane protein YdjX (TVP38/TMEM64 family)
MVSKNVKLKLWSFFGVFVVIFLFVLFSYFIQTNLIFFEGLIVGEWIGMVAYVLLKIVATVIAPITVLPLIVLAVGLWGIWIAALLTILGWTLGSVIAFGLARKFGVPIVRRLVPLEDIYKFEDKIKIGNTFWSVVFLRMIVPVDVLSYALGLFSRIGFWKYALATFIGVIPFAFIFSYLGEVSYAYQIIFGLVFLIVFLGYLIFREVKDW